MRVSVRELRNDTAAVVAAVRGGQRVTLTSRGEPIADIVPHQHRPRWVSGEWMRNQLVENQADPALTQELRELVGQTIDEL
jgi:prevent-host-death family protein